MFPSQTSSYYFLLMFYKKKFESNLTYDLKSYVQK